MKKLNSRVSRRSFLRQTATVLGAAVAAPTIIPASALGRNGLVPPSERLTMGFVGLGGQGSGHLFGGAWTYVAGGYLGRKEVQVLATCDVRRDHREGPCKRVNDAYAERYGVGNYQACVAYDDFRHILDRDDIDIMFIATPPHWHGTMAIMAAEAGKDIYCEKPTAVSISESQLVKAAVQRYGRVYQAGTQQRSEYGGNFRKAAEFVQSGRIGKLKEVYAYRDGGAIHWPGRFGASKPVPDGLDWDMWLGPMPWFPYDGITAAHRFDIGEYNWGQHHYDIIQWICGKDGTGPVEIFMEGDRSNYRYADGVVVYGKPYPDEPVGADGGACFVGTEGRIAVDRDALVSYPPDIVREPLRPDETHVYYSSSHSGNFLDCVRTRKKPICNEEVAHTSVNALLLGGICKQLKRTLKWDPAAEQFVNDDEANRMLTFAKRPPWLI